MSSPGQLTAEDRDRLAEVLPGYDIGEILGRGAGGVVVAGHHRRLRRDVALKQLAPRLGGDPRMAERFLAEARVLASLDHPHVVLLYDFVEVDGQLVLVMERLTGGTVKQRLEAGSLSPQAACAALLATCAGLEYAHRRGVLHRDVKPQNLLLSHDGVLKVADFGIAKLLGDSNAQATQTGMVLGTPAYIAPEQIAGGALTPAVDVYAAGAVLYELLCGTLPYPSLGDTLADLHQRVNTDPVPLGERAPYLPSALTAITDRALCRDPAGRYASAAELGAAIAQAADGEWQAGWIDATGIALRVGVPSTPAASASHVAEGAGGAEEPTAEATLTGSPARQHDDALLERDRERDELAVVVRAAQSRCGAAALLRGPAGIGKTRLLETAAAAGARAGTRTLRARGGEMERDFPYGVMRQLLEREVRDLDVAALGDAARLAAPVLGFGDQVAPGSADAENEFALCHGLYWLICDLAEARPLLLIVDDLHHVDAPSLRFLLYLVRRIQGLPIAIVAALRDGAQESDPATIAQLAREAGVCSISPRGLRAAGVATLVRSRLAGEPSEDFVAACMEVTGGNPFLLEQLLQAAADEGLEPDARALDRVRQLVPGAVTRSLLERLSRETPDVTALARAVAILGDDVELRHAAQLADVELVAAADCADRLADLGILREGTPLSFLHPLLRSTVLAGMRPARRAAVHARAAQVLQADAAPVAAVAAHVVELEPAADPQVVAVLRCAAQAALERGAADIAVRHLRRARREPPAQRDRGFVLAELGFAASLAGDAATAVEALDASVELADDPAERVERRLRAFRARFQLDGQLDPVEIMAIIAEVDALGDTLRGSTQPLVGDVAAAAANLPSLLPELGVRLARWESAAGDTKTERMMLATLSRVACRRGETAGRAGELAERALGGRLEPDDAEAVSRYTALFTLIDADRLDLAEEQLDATIVLARRRGSLLGYSSSIGLRALSAYQRGDVRRAVTEAVTALGTGSLHGALYPVVMACLVRARLAADDVAGAAEVVAPLGDFDLPDIIVFNHALVARAQVRFALGDLDGALAGMRLAVQRVPRAVRYSRVLPWRQLAVPVLLAAGHEDEAGAVAADDVAAARSWGTPGAIGAALSAQALCVATDQRATLLSEAIELLETSPARLDLAAAMLALGETMTDLDMTDAGLDLLWRGVELAQSCGAHALVARGQSSRRAAGARPLRVVVPDSETLTPSQRKVFDLAVRGCSPREIAEALFITIREVEDELQGVYAELGLRGPADLVASARHGLGRQA